MTFASSRCIQSCLLAPLWLAAGIGAAPAFDVAGLDHQPFALTKRAHDASCQPDSEGGWVIKTSGSDPYVQTDGLVENYPSDTPVILAFEIQAPQGLEGFQLLYQSANGLEHLTSDLAPSADWQWQLIDLTGQPVPTAWFRFDFGEQTNQTYKLRNCRLISATRALRLRAALGDKAERVDSFGISLDGIKPQPSSVETLRLADAHSQAVTLSTYRHLDLDAETKRLAIPPPVPVGPRLVAGEGEHPDNHTVVRILSPAQVCETQFLAFPLEVRGGVGVEAGRNASGEVRIVAWPLTSSAVREVRLFNQAGGSVGSIDVPTSLSPPFTVALGNFDPAEPGDELAIAARFTNNAEPPVLIYTLDGSPLAPLSIPETTADIRHEFALLASRFGLLAQNLTRKQAWQLAPSGTPIDFSAVTSPVRLFDSAYEDRTWNLGGPEDRVSTLTTWQDGRIANTLDAGRKENIFWVDPQEVHAGSEATWEPLQDGRYIKNSKYNFLGSPFYFSPLLDSGAIENRSYEDWVGGIDWERRAFVGPHRKSWSEYNAGVPATWSAVFTHRWHVASMKAISAKRDPATGLPVYLLLDRANEPSGGGYFGKRLFDYGSQNFEQDALDQLYTWPQREFYRRLAPRYRRNPKMTVAVEPNHENEIVSGSASIGDYNPKSIEGFYHYLMALYGDLETVNQKSGSAFTSDFFDAPRGIFRGDWDTYDPANLLFRDWVEYNRIIIYRRVGSSYREALLAGFPPELIKCHQIPDSYVFGSIVGISERDVRISPIDWLLTTGAGFGFSRYGTYYQREHNIAQGAHSSGFDGMLIGEYASLNPDPEKALGQLLYLRDHGVTSLHVMWWPTHLDKGYNVAQDTALREMIAKHDVPVAGLAGGIHQVRAHAGTSGSYDIASLGQGSGLIKSLRADGSFEGTVYVVPFHAHVDVELVAETDSLTASPTPAPLGTLTQLRQGAAIEVTFTVDSLSDTTGLSIGFAHAGVTLDDKQIHLEALTPGQQVRLVYKIPILLDEVNLSITTFTGSAQLSELRVIRHQDQAINLTRGIMEGQRHQGGVTFDVLPE